MKAKYKLICLFTCLLSFFLIMACKGSQTDISDKTTVASDKTTVASDKTTEVKAESNIVLLPKLLDLGAHKCIPCQKMAPILDELTKEYKGIFEVEFIDVWNPANREKAIKHKVQSIPTQIFFDEKGQELWRHVGFFSKEDILNKWKELGFDFTFAK